MKQPLIARVESAYLVKDRPEFKVGDTVDIGVRIVEGDKERVQVFTGVVTGRRGVGVTETFTVRRMVAGEGVERVFPLHSPTVSFIRSVRSGRVRRAKLMYLRERVGKATRLEERRREVVVPGEGAPADTESKA
jgi:large subunit ribosomal protein L19